MVQDHNEDYEWLGVVALILIGISANTSVAEGMRKHENNMDVANVNSDG